MNRVSELVKAEGFFFNLYSTFSEGEGKLIIDILL